MRINDRAVTAETARVIVEMLLIAVGACGLMEQVTL